MGWPGSRAQVNSYSLLALLSIYYSELLSSLFWVSTIQSYSLHSSEYLLFRATLFTLHLTRYSFFIL